MSTETKETKAELTSPTDEFKLKPFVRSNRKIWKRPGPKPSRIQAMKRVLLTGNPRGPPMIITRFLNPRELSFWATVCSVTRTYIKALTRSDWMNHLLNKITGVGAKNGWLGFPPSRLNPDKFIKTAYEWKAYVNQLLEELRIHPDVPLNIISELILNPVAYATARVKQTIAIEALLFQTSFPAAVANAPKKTKSPPPRILVMVYDEGANRHPISLELTKGCRDAKMSITGEVATESDLVICHTWSRRFRVSPAFVVICDETATYTEYSASWAPSSYRFEERGWHPRVLESADWGRLHDQLRSGRDVYYITGQGTDAVVWHLNYMESVCRPASSLMNVHRHRYKENAKLESKLG